MLKREEKKQPQILIRYVPYLISVHVNPFKMYSTTSKITFITTHILENAKKIICFIVSFSFLHGIFYLNKKNNKYLLLLLLICEIFIHF